MVYRPSSRVFRAFNERMGKTMSTSMKRQTLDEFLGLSVATDVDQEGLVSVVRAIANGAAKVHKLVESAAIGDALGSTGDTNVQGEIVQLLDTASSDIFVDVLKESGRVSVIGCEEIDKPVIAGEDDGHLYMVLMDPLDGSSNIDVAVSIGSIFGIWERDLGQPVKEDSLLRPGNEQVAAVYVVYGSSTVMVVATANSVNGFTLEPGSSTFRLTHPDLRVPSECPYYSTNEGNFNSLNEATQKAVINLRDSYSLRYVGSLVADFHRNLLKGGIFLYPGDVKRPEGRLRLMYEANPLGFVVEQAGGAATNGRQRILDVVPTQLHERTPLILGNSDVVDSTVALMNN